MQSHALERTVFRMEHEKGRQVRRWSIYKVSTKTSSNDLQVQTQTNAKLTEDKYLFPEWEFLTGFAKIFESSNGQINEDYIAFLLWKLK